jgi:MATE family multidrug resistance protein
MALFVARLGAVDTAAHQVAANVAAVMYMVPVAIGNAISVLVGQAIGARQLALARSTGIAGIALALGFAAACAVTLMAGADVVAALYSSDRNVQSVAAGLLVLAAGYHVFDALQAAAINALRGYRRAVVPFFIEVVGLWAVGLAGGYLIGLTDFISLSALGLDTPLGVRGFWIAATAGMLLASAGILCNFLWVSAPHRLRAGAETAGPR